MRCLVSISPTRTPTPHILNRDIDSLYLHLLCKGQMKLSVLRRRAQLSLTHCLRSASQVQLNSLHTSAELHITPPSRQSNNRNNALKPLPLRKIPSMPKETRESLTEVLRHNPVTQRRPKAMVDPPGIPPGATFKEMAEARIAVLEGALHNLDTSAPMQTQTAKKVRNRKLKRDAYTSEIRELKRQLESGLVGLANGSRMWTIT